ncbi:MAG: TRAP transporter fused permease subunit [Deltaproteobacteria bacterium]|nr:TRAP transporter fused permease subunit [Deltaproteobacteria bacterium]
MAEEKGQNSEFVYQVDEEKVKELVETFDPELRFRKLKGLAAKAALIMCIILALFHIYTAGFGVLQEWKHRCFHLSFVLALIYLVYPTRKIKIKNLGWAWTYEVIFSFMAGSILAMGFQSILKLGAAASGLVFAIGFFLAFAMKTRDLFRSPSVPYLDLAASIVGLGFYAYGFFTVLQNWKDYLGESGIGFAIWTFCILAALWIPLLFMLRDALRAISGKKKFKLDPQKIPYFEVMLAVLAFAFSSYIIFDFDQFIYRAGYPNTRDFILGNFAILLILEGTRRSIGVPLAILGLFSLAYCYLGPYLANIPGLSILSHRGYSPTRIIDQMYLGTEGIYGVPLGVVATFVFHFVLFGIFTMKTGLGKLFIDLATALAGWSAGGPAKVAIVASGLLGCISGSSVANTVTTGAFTIPMMKKMGYKKEFAGAVEAAASTGGQFMPPIMGAAAFIMAEFLGISYLTIATCAIIPALCHFFGVGVMVHLEAKKNNMKGIPRDQLPSVPKLIRENGILVIPLIIIIWLLVTGFTPFLAAFWGIISSVAFAQTGPRTKSFFVAVAASAPVVLFLWNPFEGPVLWTVLWFAIIVGGLIWTLRGLVFFYWIWGIIAIALLLFLLQRGTEPGRAAFWCNFFVIVVGLFLKEGRMRFEHVLDCLEWGTKNALAIGAACAAVGFIVGATTLSGLGLKFASVTIELASATAAIVDKLDFLNLFTLDHTTLFFMLAYTAVASLILGMGLPTTPNYIVVSIIAAPALLKFGVAPLLSHLFVFYFGILADLTPPVAVAAYAAAGISQGDPFKTGVRAFTLAWSGMYVPFAFVFSPVLVFMPYILQKTRGPFPYMEFIFVLATVILGIIALGAIIIGYFGRDRLKLPQRLLLVVALIGLWWHEPLSSYVGAAIMGGVYLWQCYRKPKGDYKVSQ